VEKEPTENRLLAILRQKKDIAPEKPQGKARGRKGRTTELLPPIASTTAEAQSGLAFYVCLGSEEIVYLDKMAKQNKEFGLIRHMLFTQCLMGVATLPGLKTGLDDFSRNLKSILNKLVVRIRLGKPVVIEKLRYPEVEEAVLKIRGELKAAAKASFPAAPFTPPSGKLPLRVFLTPDEVEYVVKITSQRSPNLVSHLILTQSLMAREVVPEYDLDEKIRRNLNGALKRYALLQNPLLNQVLVKIKLGKEVALGEVGKDQEEGMLHLLEMLKAAAGITK
jgi:hypothetical protein